MHRTSAHLSPLSRRLLRTAGAGALAAGLFAVASPARADRPAVRLSADIPVGGLVHSFNDNYGVTDGFFGPAAAPFQIGVGYYFKDHFYLGGRFGFQVYFPDGRDGSVLGRLTGRFEYLWSSGKVRPFVSADLGFCGYGVAAPGFATSEAGFIGGGGGGVHLFLTDSVSLSPYGELAIQRLFDVDANTFSLTFGATLAGWLWQ
ncbi:MAG: outer membrane beta-barrel protein [Polyangiaceae bacterium]